MCRPGSLQKVQKVESKVLSPLQGISANRFSPYRLPGHMLALPTLDPVVPWSAYLSLSLQ